MAGYCYFAEWYENIWVGDEKIEDITFKATANSGDVLYEK